MEPKYFQSIFNRHKQTFIIFALAIITSVDMNW